MDIIEIGNGACYQGDCIEAMQSLIDAGFAGTFHAVVTDPPYGLEFMGKSWDSKRTVAFDPATWKLAFELLRPGGHLLAFSGSRTYHRMACAVEDAGFEIRDQIMWIYGCLSDDTMALTPSGPKRYDDLAIGDSVVCFDPSDNSYVIQPIEAVHVYNVDDTAYRIRGDGTDQIVSRNHRCLVERGGRIEFVVAERAEAQMVVPVLEDVPGLLKAIRGDDKGTSNTEQDLLAGVQEGGDWRGQQGAAPIGRIEGQDSGSVRRVRQGVLAEHEAHGASEGSDVFQALQRDFSGSGLGCPCPQGQIGMDGHIGGIRQGEDDGSAQSCMEGRRHDSTLARKPQGGSVCAVPASILGHVEARRLRDGAPPDGSGSYREDINADGSRASHQPQSTGQSDRKSDAVRHEQGPQTVRGWKGHKSAMVAVDPIRYRGVVWCLTVPTGTFVAVRNGMAFPTGNSGFPKSLDVSKAIDKSRGGLEFAAIRAYLRSAVKSSGITQKDIKAHLGYPLDSGIIGHWIGISQPSLPGWPDWQSMKEILPIDDRFDDLIQWHGHEREIVGTGISGIGAAFGDGEWASGKQEFAITIPATDAARQWRGWGTALKPAHEPIVVARKPLIGTVAENVLTHGTGAMNIDGCRVPFSGHADEAESKGKNQHADFESGPMANAVYGKFTKDRDNYDPPGRWPANVVHDGSDEVLDAFWAYGEKNGGHHPKTRGKGAISTSGHAGQDGLDERHSDAGTAARFFYSAKASKADRAGSKHPTVKPVSLMRYLVRLVTPPGGVVLDPFAGSGTTLEAAVAEGFFAVGCEMTADYWSDIEGRLRRVQPHLTAAETDSKAA